MKKKTRASPPGSSPHRSARPEASDGGRSIGSVASCLRLRPPAEEQPAVLERGVAQRDGQRLAEGRDRKDLELAADLLRQILDVRLVLLRNDDLEDPGAHRAQDLLL